MKKSDSKSSKETPEQELKRLRLENAKLKAKQEADKAKIEQLRKELKKKEDPKPKLTDEQREQLLTLFRDIGSLFK